MNLLFTPITFIEASIFFLALIAFVLAVRFFQNTRRRLQELFPDTVRNRRLLPFTVDRNGFILPNKGRVKAVTVSQPDANHQELKMLRSQLQQQQQQLEKALAQFQAFHQKATAMPVHSTVALAIQKPEHLQEQFTKQDSGQHGLERQTAHSQALLNRLAEAEAELEDLQTAAQHTQKQAWQTAELSLQLEHAETKQAELEETLLDKEEELRELRFEKERLQDALGKLRDELSQATTQRQQLLKKTQFLEAVHADLHQVSDANKKLKAEKTRVAELESMMELMTVTCPKAFR